MTTTAILYSGLFRSFPEIILNNIECFKTFSDKIDLYFSIWDYVGYANHLNDPDYIKAKRSFHPDVKITEEIIKNIIPKDFSLNIKAIKIEPYNRNNYKLGLFGEANDNLEAQYYKIFDCFSLLDEKEDYDLIVRTRCDLLLNNVFNKELITGYASNNKIMFPRNIWHNYPKQLKDRSINELFWISNKKIMKRPAIFIIILKK